MPWWGWLLTSLAVFAAAGLLASRHLFDGWW